MKPNFLIAFTAAFLTTGAWASPPEVGTALGSTLAQAQQALAEADYTITKYEIEGSWIEIVAVDAGTRLELRVNAADGRVISVESRARGGQATTPGMATSEILAKLEDLGYQIVGFEREHREFEAYALREGQRWELRVDPATGSILTAERDE